MTNAVSRNGKGADAEDAAAPLRRFHTAVHVRWSDMDVFQHVNHARMVTLLEEARIPWLFEDDRPTVALRNGCVLADLHVKYRVQLRHDDTPLDIAMWIEQLRAVDFTVAYEVRAAAADPGSPAAVTATTQLAAFDIESQRLRRLTRPERDYLAQWSAR